MAKRLYKYLNPEVAARLGRINIVARAVVEGFVTGLHRSPYHGFSVEFSEHREYTPGDNLRDLDWKALGKTDRYYIKQYEEETNLRAYVLLDCSASMSYGSEGLTKFQYSCYLAAALAYLMVRQQDAVGLVAFDEAIRTFIRPSSTTVHLNLILRELERLQPGNQTQLSETFHHLAENIRRRALIIVLSDLFDEQREVLRALRHFRHKKHEVIIFHVLDHAEVEFPFQQLSDFIDAETRERLQVDPRYVRDSYLELVNEFINQYKLECSSGQIDYVPTDTSVPYDLMLMAYMNKRKKLG